MPDQDAIDQLRADYHARWCEAVEEERKRRESVFLPCRQVCGIKVRPPTLRHIELIVGLEHPLLFGGLVLPSDLALFLWMLLPDWQLGKEPDKAFFKRVARLPYAEVRNDLAALLEEAFYDMPGAGDEGQKQTPVSYTASFTPWLDFFASEYHWTIEHIYNTPFCQLVQLYRQRQIAKRDKAALINPSDRIRNEFFKKLNEMQSVSRN